MRLVCPQCKSVSFVKFGSYISHCLLAHGKKVLCFVPECKSKVVTNLYQHVRVAHLKVHDEWRRKNTIQESNIPISFDNVNSDQNQVGNNQPSCSQNDMIDFEGDEQDNDDELPEQEVDGEGEQGSSFNLESSSTDEVVKNLFRDLMDVKEGSFMNDNQFISIVKTFFIMLDSVSGRQDEKSIMYQVREIFSSCWNMKKFLKEKFPYIEPQPMEISGRQSYRVPIQSIIERYLRDGDTFNLVKDAHSYTPRTDGSIHSFRDTQNFKQDYSGILKMVKRKRHPHPILFVFYDWYQDDFGLANPIGPSASNSQVFAVYVSLSDIPLNRKSRRQDQSLVTIISREDVQDSGIRFALDKIKKEVNQLQNEGFIFEGHGEKYHVYAIINKFCTDNLAAMEILGRRKVFNSGSICRVCTATYSEIQVDPFARSSSYRTDEQMAIDTHVLMTHGIVQNGQSDIPVFMDSSFMTITNQYPNDRLHMIILGVYQNFLEGCLSKFIGTRLLDSFNRTMKGMKLKNGPAILKKVQKGYHLKGIGSQVYDTFINLTEILVRMIFDSIFFDSEVKETQWEDITSSRQFRTYIILRKLDCYITQSTYSRQNLGSMNTLMESFLEGRALCDFHQTVIPKLHHFTHLVHDTKIHGPLINYDNLRYERRHSDFVHKMKTIKCNKNRSKTLVEWDSRMAALRQDSGKGITLLGSRRRLTNEELTAMGRLDSGNLFKVIGVKTIEGEIRVGDVKQLPDGFMLVKIIVPGADGIFAFGIKYRIRTLDENLHVYHVIEENRQTYSCYPVSSFAHLKTSLRIFKLKERILINKIIN